MHSLRSFSEVTSMRTIRVGDLNNKEPNPDKYILNNKNFINFFVHLELFPDVTYDKDIALIKTSPKDG